jgi:hypothetical protein
MRVWVDGREEVRASLVAGAAGKGEFRCAGCGYGITVYRKLPRCPMCGTESWEQLDGFVSGRMSSATQFGGIL